MNGLADIRGDRGVAAMRHPAEHCGAGGGRERSSTDLIDWTGTLVDLVLPRRPGKLLVKVGMLARDRLGGRLVEVPIAACMNPYAYAYGPSGWSYYRDLAAELLREPDLPFERSRFFRFFREIDAPSFTDNLCLHDPALRSRFPRMPYGSFPWGVYEWEAIEVDPRRFYDRADRPRRSHENPRAAYFEWMFHDKSEEARRGLERDFDKVAELVRSFRRFGYRPLRGGGYAVPTAGVLARRSGELRFLVKDGNHRLGLLGALGCERVWVRLDPRRFPPVRETRLARSPWVRGGLLTLAQAERLFQLFFELTGAERARAVGLVSGEPAEESR